MFEKPLTYRPADNETARHTRELLTLYRVSSVLGSNQPQEYSAD